MICATLLCVAAASSAGPTDEVWFTLHGDPDEPAKNLVQVLPEPVGVDQRVLLDLRVSRDTVRTSFNGQRYRSYYAKVVVHCTDRTAWYLSLSYYGLPQWEGKVLSREQHAPGSAPVLLKDVPGEPYKGMIAAACRSRG